MLTFNAAILLLFPDPQMVPENHQECLLSTIKSGPKISLKKIGICLILIDKLDQYWFNFLSYAGNILIQGKWYAYFSTDSYPAMKLWVPLCLVWSKILRNEEIQVQVHGKEPSKLKIACLPKTQHKSVGSQEDESRKPTLTLSANQGNELIPHTEAESIRNGNDQLALFSMNFII